LMERNHGRLPDPKGGRPTDEHRRLLIAAHVREAIASHSGKWGSVELALKQVAKDDGVSYEYVREIHYDRDPEWRRVVDVELAWRKFLAEGSPLPFVVHRYCSCSHAELRGVAKCGPRARRRSCTSHPNNQSGV
jgi:hypothetical protein